tara:strand:+ start:226 stop:333 length:108 start_codon:yes stop_codon:yes gene_type:complete
MKKDDKLKEYAKSIIAKVVERERKESCKQQEARFD